MFAIDCGRSRDPLLAYCLSRPRGLSPAPPPTPAAHVDNLAHRLGQARIFKREQYLEALISTANLVSCVGGHIEHGAGARGKIWNADAKTQKTGGATWFDVDCNYRKCPSGSI